jgi:predicted enzyme related to lactoylglutathione lyase
MRIRSARPSATSSSIRGLGSFTLAGRGLCRFTGEVNPTSVTVALPVRDLTSAVAWYRRAFAIEEDPVSPAPGLAEFVVGPIELQLSEEPVDRSGAQITLRFGVENAALEHARLSTLGVEVGELLHIPAVVDVFDFSDPDGNLLSVYSLAS